MKKAFIFLVIVGFSTIAFAEPTPAVNYLMNEPVSMLDFGIFQLSKLIKHFFIPVPHRKVSDNSNVYYDWEKNRIVLNFIVVLKTNDLKEKDPKEICAELTKWCRIKFEISKSELFRESNGIIKYFRHINYIKVNEPKNLMAEIENITYITVQIYEIPTDKEGKVYYSDLLLRPDSDRLKAISESPLMGKSILFHDK